MKLYKIDKDIFEKNLADLPRKKELVVLEDKEHVFIVSNTFSTLIVYLSFFPSDIQLVESAINLWDCIPEDLAGQLNYRL